MASPMYLGVEIGATKLQAALGDGLGNILLLRRVHARPEGGRQGVCEQIAELVGELMQLSVTASANVETVGIGFGGPVDSRAGRTLRSHQVAGWEDFPILAWFAQATGVPAVLGNDSDLAGLAEAHFGAGRGVSPVVYMNIGSGIGGSLIVDGRLYEGQGIGSMEIGHLRIAAAEQEQPLRTLELLCSGWGMAEQARCAANLDRGSLLWQLAGDARANITAEVLAEAIRKNDAAARQVWSVAVRRLGVAIANVITLLHPARFVLGGGVSLVGELLLAPLREQVARHVFEPFAQTYSLVPAALGEDVVVHGALKLAREHTRRDG